METETNTAVIEQDADSFLSQGLANTDGIDTSGYSTQPSKVDENTTLKTDTQDRGTDDPTAKTETTTSEEVDKTSATSSKADRNDKGQFKGRSGDRKVEIQNDIQALIAEKKKIQDEVNQMKSQNATVSNPQTTTQPQVQAEAPVRVPKPDYTLEAVTGLIKSYKAKYHEAVANGDLAGMTQNTEILDTLSTKLEEVRTWEARNKAENDRYNSSAIAVREQVLKDHPDMANEKSPIRQEYNKVHARFMELNQNPALLERELASIASLRTKSANHASEKAALEEKVKTLQQKLSTLEDKNKPLKQDEAPTASETRESDDPDVLLSREIRNFLPRKR